MDNKEELITYPLASTWWSAEGILFVRDRWQQVLLELPLQFLRLGGVCTYGYVKQQYHNTFTEEGGLFRMDGSVISDAEFVVAGEIYFEHDSESAGRGEEGSCMRANHSSAKESLTHFHLWVSVARESCRPRQGPRFKYKYRAPIEGGSASSMSNSRRSSANQAST